MHYSTIRTLESYFANYMSCIANRWANGVEIARLWCHFHDL